MANVIAYNGSDKWKIKATELLNQSGGGLVDDVTVNGTSVVTNKVAEIDLTGYAESADLATVATSGSYTDLTDKPTIPSAQVNSDWNASSGVAEILNKPSIPSTAGDVGAYTQAEVDGLLDDKADATALDDYLPLSGGRMAGNISRQPPNVIIDASTNNHVTSNTQVSGYYFVDNNDTIFTRYQSYLTNAGAVAARIAAQNMDTNGDSYTNYFYVGVRKNGELYYSMTDPAAFRSAIGIEEAPSVVEDVKSSSQAVSVADTTHTTVLQISLTPGTWMVNATAIFASNATGYRQMYVSTSDTSTSALNTMSATSPAANGVITALNTGRAVSISNNTTLYMRVRHSRGAALDVYGRLTAVKIINV